MRACEEHREAEERAMRFGATITRVVDRLRSVVAWSHRFDAPVLVQELRVRQRGVKPFAVMFVYSLILSAIALLVMYFCWPSAGDPTPSQMAEVGQLMFMYLSMAQLVMVALIVPAYSAAAVSSERESGTFDLLALTLLSSTGIVTQKLAAAIAQSLMLIVASLPIMALVFLLGGVSPFDVMVAFGLLIVTSVMLGALGMLCSCCMRSSKTSTFVTYLVTFCLFVGVPMGVAWFESMSRARPFETLDTGTLLLFMAGFLFVGGVGAVLVYPVAALIMHNRPLWQVRAFRMSIFGAVYAITLLLVTCPAITESVIGSGSSPWRIPLALYVNPYAALAMFMETRSGGGMGSVAYCMVAATTVFSLGCAYLFRHISSARLAGLRRS